MPTAPAPTTMSLAGTSRERRMWSLVTIRSPSGSMPGSDFVREPVARMVSFDVSTRSPVGWPASSVVATEIVVAPSSVAVPRMYSTLCFLTRNMRPLVIFSTMPSRRSAITPRSSPISPTVMPNSAAWRTRSTRSADSSIALVGMQPTCRQVPPMR